MNIQSKRSSNAGDTSLGSGTFDESTLGEINGDDNKAEYLQRYIW
jgi:hypothetical protein